MRRARYELIAMINCRLCGRLYQRHRLGHKPTDEEKLEFQRAVTEDHLKLHELNHELNEARAKFDC